MTDVTSDDDDDLYSFPHRTFQEYLAGLYLLRTDFPKELARLGREDPNRWREALLLAAASQRNVPYTVWALIGKLCPTPPPVPAKASTPEPVGVEALAGSPSVWGAFLAGQVLVETELLKNETSLDGDEIRKKEQVHQWHKTIITTGLLPPRDRAQAGDLLAELGDDRPGVLSCDDMPLCYVPPGEFWMGDEQKNTKGHWNNSLDKPYWLAQYPVTVAQFRQFAQDSGFNPSDGDSLRGVLNRPVIWVNWYDALAFCDWLTRRWQKQLPSGYRVTLPSEAEWEKAARGGKLIPATIQPDTITTLRSTLASLPATRPNDEEKREYPWGNESEQEEIRPGVSLFRANNETSGIGRASAVGSFPAGASPVGCLDLSGNVWEWTRSLWGKDWDKDDYSYPYKPEEREDLKASSDIKRILRGGGWGNDSVGCSARDWCGPLDGIIGGRGFRVVVSPFVSEH